MDLLKILTFCAYLSGGALLIFLFWGKLPNTRKSYRRRYRPKKKLSTKLTLGLFAILIIGIFLKNPQSILSKTSQLSENINASPLIGEKVLVKVSHYTPPEGGPSCAIFRDNYCHSRTASGERWEDWYPGYSLMPKNGIACVREWPFYTKVTVLGETWTCIDRGGAIVKTPEGHYWIDMLTPYPRVDFGTVVEATVIFP